MSLLRKKLITQKDSPMEIVTAETLKSEQPTVSTVSNITQEQIEFFMDSLETLTKTERIVFNYYIELKTTKEIMSELEIKENTLKFHNKNLYSKLGVSSRKQLMEIYKHTGIK